MIEFETRTQREKEMVEAVAGLIAGIDLRKMDGDLQSSLMQSAMKSGAAQYMDMIMSPGGLLPFKTEALRQLIMYGGNEPVPGRSMAKTTAKAQPVKYALTAMGMAAISSGEGGRDAAMSRYLPEIMKGRLFCYCITEPGAGTNTNKVSTIAVDNGDHFVMNGQKTYISAADTSHYMVVVARIVKDGEEQGVGTFIMETATAGISMTELDIAVLGDKQFTIYYDDVKIPKDALVGSKSGTKSGGKISASVFYTLNLERIIVGFTTLRLCQEALSRAMERAAIPASDGRVPGSDPDIKRRIAKVKLKLEQASLATKRACVAYDNSENPVVMGTFANMAKYLSTMAANEACQLALELYGVEGLDKDKDDVGGDYLMARLLRVAPINNEMVLNFLGEHMLGLPKSYR